MTVALRPSLSVVTVGAGASRSMRLLHTGVWIAGLLRIEGNFLASPSPAPPSSTSGSWLNLVEVLFVIISRQAIRRDSFDNVKQLVAAIRAYMDGCNERCQPIVWTKSADTILLKATR